MNKRSSQKRKKAVNAKPRTRTKSREDEHSPSAEDRPVRASKIEKSELEEMLLYFFLDFFERTTSVSGDVLSKKEKAEMVEEMFTEWLRNDPEMRELQENAEEHILRAQTIFDNAQAQLDEKRELEVFGEVDEREILKAKAMFEAGRLESSRSEIEEEGFGELGSIKDTAGSRALEADIETGHTEVGKDKEEEEHYNALTDSEIAVKIDTNKQQEMLEKPPGRPSPVPPEETVLEEEVIRKIEAYFGIPFEEIATYVGASRNKARLGAVIEATKGYEAVQSESFRKNPKSYLDRLSSGTCFLIKQQDRETALLLPYRDDVSAFAEVVSATDLNRKLGAFLDQVWELKSFVILRHGRKEGLLVPTARRLSGEPELEASVKLSLVAGLTIQQTRDAIDLWLVMNRGKLK